MSRSRSIFNKLYGVPPGPDTLKLDRFPDGIVLGVVAAGYWPGDG